jgi:hypothetical protein
MTTKQFSKSKSAVEARARRAARRVDMRATKTAWRKDSCDNYGHFMLIDDRLGVIDGVRYDMTAEEVIDYCTERMD